MPRKGGVVLEGYAHHVVQRGHNRCVVYADPGDYQERKKGSVRLGYAAYFSGWESRPGNR